jgi:hypothetical protein
LPALLTAAAALAIALGRGRLELAAHNDERRRGGISTACGPSVLRLTSLELEPLLELVR